MLNDNRSYFRIKCSQIKFNIMEKITGYKEEKSRFKKLLGYNLNLSNPRTFNEKVVWKKIYDRNPLLPITADKFLVREYLKKQLGKERAEHILIPLLHATHEPETIPFKALPDEYVIKANHASRCNIFANKDCRLDQQDVIRQCRQWLSYSYGCYHHEWAYQKIRPMIVVEKLLKDQTGNLPLDYKFFVFHGKCEFIQVDSERYNNHARCIYDPDWNLLDFKKDTTIKQGLPISKPDNLNDMLVLAENIAIKFDFVRIDLYSIDNNIFFGEITHYPASGTSKFEPPEYDTIVGSYWKIKPKYWLS